MAALVPPNEIFAVPILFIILAGLVLTTTCVDVVGAYYIDRLHFFGRRLDDVRTQDSQFILFYFEISGSLVMAERSTTKKNRSNEKRGDEKIIRDCNSTSSHSINW